VSKLIEQYRDAKARHPNMLLLFRVGDFYEAFMEDAETIGRVLGLTVTTRDKAVPMAGFPHHSLEAHLRKLLTLGKRVAVCEPVEDAPAIAKTAKQEVRRIVTPGSIAEEPSRMKTISVWQPWSSLLVNGAKRIETRGWELRHRGTMLIHAAKTWNSAIDDMCRREPFTSLFRRHGWRSLVPTGRGKLRHPDGLPFGAIVGRVEVVDCVPVAKLDLSKFGEHEAALGDYSAGRFGIICERPVQFETPIPWTGKQGLFDVDTDEMAKKMGTLLTSNSRADPEPAGLFG
jgi:hypothetical protein